MTIEEFNQKLHRRIAQVAIGASSLRNQGGAGIIEGCRQYCESKISLETFIDSLRYNDAYRTFLNNHTDALVSYLPINVQHWGAARKGLNLFLRDVIYNRFITDWFSLPTSESAFHDLIAPMEVPLDKYVIQGIKANTKTKLPRWWGVKKLEAPDSLLYQQAASQIAALENIARVHLDLKYYRPEENHA